MSGIFSSFRESIARPAATTLVAVDGEIWRVSAPSLDEFKPTLGADEYFGILSKIESAAAVARLACVSSEFTAAVGAWRAETQTLCMESLPIDDNQLRRLLDIMPHVTSLDLGGCRGLTSDGIVMAVLTVRLLQRLILTGTAIDAHGFAQLWTSLPNLTAIDADGCDELTELDACLLASPRGGAPAGAIVSLSIAGCHELTGRGDVTSLCRACGASLTALDASGYDDLDAHSLSVIGAACPSLRRLRLAEAERVGDDALLTLVESCPDLRVADVSWCSALTTHSVVTLALRCSCLQVMAADCDSIAASR